MVIANLFLKTKTGDTSTARMDIFGELENVAFRLETVALSGCQAPEVPNGKDNSPAQILRIKEKMANQCFEMQVKISAEKLKKSCGEQDSSRDMSECECESEIEEARINHCNKTLALQRMQIWWSISEKLRKNDTESEMLKVSAKHSLELCSKILEVQQEASEIKDQVFQLQKKRLDLKRLIHEKMKEMEELKRMREHPEEGKYKKALEKGQEYLQKYQKMATMTQNVLQGTILASKVNWRDDPKLKDIALELEDIQLF